MLTIVPVAASVPVTVNVNAPVPTTGGVVGFELPPQPIAKPPPSTSSSASIVKRFRRRAGMQRKNTPARAAPPAVPNQFAWGGRADAVAVVLVVTVMVAVTGVVPVTTTLLPVPKLQAGSSLAPVGADVIAHFRLTCPVNPPAGVSVTVEVPEPPRLAMDTAVPDTVKPAGVVGALTVTITLAVATVAPFAVAVME